MNNIDSMEAMRIIYEHDFGPLGRKENVDNGNER